MSWADEFASPLAPTTGRWSDQFANPTPPASPPPPDSWISQAGDYAARQVGLTVRHGITGITGIPALIGNGLNTGINYGIQGVNSLAGTNIPQLQMPSSVIQQAETSAGLPEPKNGLERVVGDATSAMAGVGGTYKLGQALMGFASPAAQAVGQTLTSVPGNQIAAAGTAGASAGGAREAGLGPGWQLGAGLLGGVIGGVGSAALGPLAARASRYIMPQQANPAAAPAAVESVTSNTATPPSPEAAATLAQRTAAILSNSENADPMAAARLADFKALGMTPTLGQATRDPGLFAQEQNWRGMPAGKPILQRLSTQNSQLAQALGSVAGSGSGDLTDAKTVMASLKSADDALKTQVTQAYKDASASTGAQLDVPLQGVAQDYATVLQNFGDKVPSGVRNNFNALGLTSGTQKKIFTVDDAENLLKVINQNQSTDPATNLALKQLSSSVKNAVLSADDQGGAFAPARALAAQRFALQDKVPALDAVVYGKIAPDNFVQRFIINGNADDVSGMAKVLQDSPSGMKALQGQVGNKLQEAAFGQNMGGQKQFAPERYATVLNKTLGPDVLKSIYSPDQIDDLNTIGRVGAYINSTVTFFSSSRIMSFNTSLVISRVTSILLSFA